MKRMKKNRRISSRINGFVVVLFIAATAVILGITLLQFNNYSNSQNSEQALKGMESLNRTIDSYKSHSKELAAAIAADSDVAAMIVNKDSAGLAAKLGAIGENAGVDYIAVTDAGGVALAGSSDYVKAGDDVSGQENISQAMAGTAAALIEEDDVLQLAVRSAVPVLDANGAVAGVVTAGYALNNTDFVDSAKEVYKTDFTLFKGDLRVNTTLVKDGERAIGTTLDPKIADIVLTKGENYEGSAKVLGQDYLVAYMPLKNTNGEVIGAFFSGQPAAQAKAESNRILAWALIVAAAAVAVLVILSNLFIKRIVARPLEKLVARAKKISAGDIETMDDPEAKRGDEIGVLFGAFGEVSVSVLRMTEDVNMLTKAAVAGDFEERADAGRHAGEYKTIVEGVNNMLDSVLQPINKASQCLEVIARGDDYGLIDTELFNGNFKTIMGNLNSLMLSLYYLRTDAFKLADEAIGGNLSARADTGKHKGGYRKIIEGVNSTLDAVINPITEVTAVLNEMAKGNLNVTVEGDYKGDHAIIKNAMNETIRSIKGYISEISEVLGNLAQGDLRVEITSEYKGNFVELKDSINRITVSLNELMSDISTAADQVNRGAQQVSNGNQAISQGATEQASSIEELSVSLTQIGKQTKENTENARLSNTMAMEAKSAAAQGSAQMTEMLRSMEEINESSESISKIIKVIDDIAFQTNMLALNAAVEAARAGVHGKGFAVVAEEVRNLAARSAKAAKETEELIEGSKKKVGAGTTIANATAEALKKIVAGVDKTVELGELITSSSDEQTTGILQVNQGIDQLSSVVQTNSATSQEGAAASEELSGQAELLREKIGLFKLKEESARISAGRGLAKKETFALLDEMDFLDSGLKY